MLAPGLEQDLLRPDRQRDLGARDGISRRIGQEIEPAFHPAMDEIPLALGDLGLDEIRVADEIGDEAVDRPLIDVERRAQLLDLALAHDRDPVAHGERLFLVVGHEDEGDAGAPLQVLELAAHLLAELEVEGRERLVQQQHLGMIGQRARQGDPLLLPAGELGGAPSAQPRHLDQGQHLLDDAADLLLGRAPHLQSEGDVLRHRHMGEQGIALEDGIDRPLIGRQMLDRAALEQDLAGARLLEAGDQAQQRGLAAARGAQEGEELVLPDGDRDVVEGPHALLSGAEDLRNSAGFDRCDVCQNRGLPAGVFAFRRAGEI